MLTGFSRKDTLRSVLTLGFRGPIAGFGVGGIFCGTPRSGTVEIAFLFGTNLGFGRKFSGTCGIVPFYRSLIAKKSPPWGRGSGTQGSRPSRGPRRLFREVLGLCPQQDVNGVKLPLDFVKFLKRFTRFFATAGVQIFGGVRLSYRCTVLHLCVAVDSVG